MTTTCEHTHPYNEKEPCLCLEERTKARLSCVVRCPDQNGNNNGRTNTMTTPMIT